MNQTAEISSQTSPTDQLRDLRWQMAEVRGIELMLDEMYTADQIHNPKTTLAKCYVSSPWDEGFVSLETYCALDALGVPREAIQNASTDGHIADRTPLSGGPTLTVKKMSAEGIVLKLSDVPQGSTDYHGRYTGFADHIKDRYKQSPAHRALEKAVDAVRGVSDSTKIPDTIGLEAFALAEDPLGTLIFLKDIGFPADIYYGASRRFATGENPASILQGCFGSVVGREGVIDCDDFTRVIWGDAVQKTLFYDKHAGTCKVTFSTRSEGKYVEQANQASEVKVLPFIETECAQEIIAACENAGLMLHPDIQASIVLPDDDKRNRHGSLYTQITRELAKWVNNPKRTMTTKLFVPKDERFDLEKYLPSFDDNHWSPYDQRYQEDEKQVRRALLNIDVQEMGEAAGVVFRMAQECLRRPDEGDIPTDLRVTKERISITAGACFDVASYYAGGAAESIHFGGVLPVSEDSVLLLEKKTGAETHLLTHPIVFNGVQLPVGALMKKTGDGGWAFLRLTPFSFDNATDSQVFAAETTKAKNVLELSGKVGEMTLAELIAGANYRKIRGAKR